MKEKRFPILSWDLLNRKKNERVIAFILLLLLFCIFCNLDWYLHMIQNRLSDVIGVYTLGSQTTAWFFPIMMSVAAALPIYSYCSEWKNGYWRLIMDRVGKARYLREKPVSCFIQSFLVFLIGQLLYVLFLIISAKLSGALILEESYCPMPDHPLIYLMLSCISLAMAAGFWGSLAFLLASWQMDLFMAIIVPLAGYISLTWVLSQSFLHLNIKEIAYLQTDYGHPGISLLFSIAFFSLLSILCMSGARKLIIRRIENEHVA